jgi:hypothetical protein
MVSRYGRRVEHGSVALVGPADAVGEQRLEPGVGGHAGVLAVRKEVSGCCRKWDRGCGSYQTREMPYRSKTASALTSDIPSAAA